MKKYVSIMLTVFLMLFVFTTGVSLFATGKKDGAAEEEIVLRVLDPTWDPMQKLWQEKIIPQFEAMHPNVTIQYEWVEWGPILREKAVLAHTSGAPYDVFMIPDWYMPGLVKLGVLSPVEPKYFGARSMKEIKDRYVDGALDRTVTYGGKLYAIPVEMSAHVYIYNPRHFEEIGRDADDAPDTFEEMLDIAKKLTKRDSSGALIRSGFYPNVYPGSNAGFMMVGPQIVQLGGRYFDETWTEPNFVTPEAIKAYTLFQDLFMPDKIGCAELGFAIDENQMGADFVAGRVSQIYGGAYMNSIFEGIDPGFKDYVYAPIPPLKDAKQKAVAVWGAIYCVDTASEHQDLAWELVNFMSEEQFAAIWMLECGMYTALKGDWLDEVLAEIPDYKVMFDAIGYGVSTMKTDFNDEIETALTEHMERIISLKMDVKESLEILQKDAETIMSQAK